ncbi:MAG: acyl-CoA/acyl-ACP dehydrogenase [archaeon]|nr:acyl-CoA/acyl-ACP dehydrogenase [archaeon]
MKTVEVKAINEEIMSQLSLKKRYAFQNANFMALLTQEQSKFMNKVQRFCIKQDKVVDHALDDIYDWIPAFGAKGYVSRSNPFSEFDLGWNGPDSYTGLTADLLRAIALDSFNPQFNFSAGATMLAVNPLYHHNEGRPERIAAVKEMLTGNAVGCILITEPEVGSDAVRPLTKWTPVEGGGLVNGVKIYNTNAPKSKYAVFYAAQEPGNSKTVMQGYVTLPHENVLVERVNIPWTPKCYLGKETFKDTFIPDGDVLGPVGKGKAHMFEGLNLERFGIAILDAGEMWTALSYGVIYCNLRKQMGEIILKHQGVGFLLSDLWAKASTFTLAMLKFTQTYDDAYKRFDGKIPKQLDMQFMPVITQLKYYGAILAERISYEIANLMGGAGVCDQTLMHDLLGISRIQEVIGGTRQIQQYVMSMSLRQIFKMI